jgi:hypothetical protein
MMRAFIFLLLLLFSSFNSVVGCQSCPKAIARQHQYAIVFFYVVADESKRLYNETTEVNDVAVIKNLIEQKYGPVKIYFLTQFYGPCN